MSILIVEDNPVNARILEINLKKNSYQTILATAAKEALEYLTSMPEIQLVITDIMMPVMNGLEFLNEMKERPEWKDIPVIMCSSLADSETVKKAIKAGCRHYLIKPINKEHLLQKVREALEHEKPVLRDKREVISQLGIDDETYQEIVSTFTDQVSDKIAQLEKRIGGETVPEISIGLLELLENATYFGAERIRILLEELSSESEEIENETRNSEYPLLLRELKKLQHVLTALSPKEAPTSEKENEENDSKRQGIEDTLNTVPGKD